MEKFRKFADPQTGINLFVPPFCNHRTTILSRLLHCTIGALLVTIRVPLISLLLLLAFIIDIVTPIKSITKLSNKFIFRSILFIMGFYSIESNVQSDEEQGSIILSNHSSPVDILYFMQQGSVSLTRMITTQQSIQLQLLRIKAIIGCLFSCQSYPLKDGQGLTLSGALQESQQSVLIFFEGCKTNGLGVLSPHNDLFKQIQDNKLRVNCYAISYNDKSLYTPVNTTRNGYWHFLIVCSNLVNKMRVVNQEFENVSDYRKMIRVFYDSEGFRIINQDWEVSAAFLEYYRQSKTKKE